MRLLYIYSLCLSISIDDFIYFSFGYTISIEVINMEYPYSETGSRILNLRLAQKLTREKLAERADISVQFLADIEKGRKNMTVTTLRKLSLALLVTTDYIVNGKESSSSNIENELIELFRIIPPDKQKYALELLKLFTESIF